MLDGTQLTRGESRELLDAENAELGRSRGWLVEDPRRTRPRYEDGRFLTARDLTRDQQYFLTRQADLGQLTGGGVMAGLEVALIEATRRIRVGAGHGLTPAGELVAVRQTVEVDLNDLPRVQNLEATFGLDTRALPPLRTQSGCFVLALRPVEFTANPVALYPTSVSGERRLEDGDIIEATAITLIPFPGERMRDAALQARARLAKQVFIGEPLGGLPAGALPIAVVGVDRGVVRWVDQDLVRREASVDGALSLSSLGRRSVREAYFRQYLRHLADVLRDRGAAGLDERITATDYFEALPPVGALPVASVEVREREIVQWFLPSEMTVELTLLPRDELPGLVNEALALPPIDLGAGPDALEAIPMLIVAPIERSEFQRLALQLQGVTSITPARRAVRPVARVRPVDVLNALRLRRLAPAPADPVPIDLGPWSTALTSLQQGGGSLLFVRRRQLPQVAHVVPRIRITEPDLAGNLAPLAQQRLAAASETDRFNGVFATAPAEGLERAESLLTQPDPPAPRFGRHMIVNGFMAELSYRTRRRIVPLAEQGPLGTAPGPGAAAALRIRPLTLEDVEVVALRYAASELGSGIQQLESALPANRSDVGPAELEALDIDIDELPENPRLAFDSAAVGQVLAQALRIPEIDLKARGLGTPELRRAFALGLLVRAQRADVPGIRTLVGIVVEPNQNPPVDSPVWDVVDRMGEGKPFAIVYEGSEPEVRDALDQLIAQPWMSGPADNPRAGARLLSTGLLMELVLVGWGIELRNGADVGQVLDAIDNWTAGDLVVPGLSSPPPAGRPRLTIGDPRVDEGILATYRVLDERAPVALERLALSQAPRDRRVFGCARLCNDYASVLQSTRITDATATAAGGAINTAIAARDLVQISSLFTSLDTVAGGGG